jgi:threonine synthase
MSRQYALHKYLADYINEERQRRRPINPETISDAIDAFESGAYDGAIRDVIVSDNSKVSEIELTLAGMIEDFETVETGLIHESGLPDWIYDREGWDSLAQGLKKVVKQLKRKGVI